MTTSEYWETRFRNEGVMWSFEPSNSAIATIDLFNLNGLKKVLIPGCGYGRNLKLFVENDFSVTGIEISQSAIDLAKKNGINCKIHHGSVVSMPFDNEVYDGIYCYSLIHLLNRTERRLFIESCFQQLKVGGLMVFVVTSINMSLYGSGKNLSKNRYEISNGLKVYFYNQEAVEKEFSPFGLIVSEDIEEPIKYMAGYEPIKLSQVICRK